MTNEQGNKPGARRHQSENKGTAGTRRNVAVPWGRAASEYRPGLFAKLYFLDHREACAADIYHDLSRKIERLNKERTGIGDTPLRRPNYASFSRYLHWFLILKLIERTDRREAAVYPFLQQRVFYKLTAKGK